MRATRNYYGCPMEPHQFRRRVEQLKIALPRLMAETGADAVVVTGISGMSVAFALLAQIPFNLFVVRKPHESSHGKAIQGPMDVSVRRYIILDDLVASGNTIRNIDQAVNDWCESQRFPVPELVGIMTHSEDGYGRHIRYQHGGSNEVRVTGMDERLSA